MKGYKITNCAQDKRIGIVGNSLTEVFAKGCQKLKVTINIFILTLAPMYFEIVCKIIIMFYLIYFHQTIDSYIILKVL